MTDKAVARRRLQTSLKWLLSGSLLALVLWRVPLDEIANNLVRAQPGGLVGGFALFVVMRVPAAYRMHLITQLQRMSLSTFEIFKISLVTSFFGLFLPGYIAGGAIRWHMLSKDNKGVEALASVAFDRVNDTIVLMSFGCICMLVGSEASVPPGVPWILTGTLLSLLVAYAMLLNERTTRLTMRLAEAMGLHRLRWLHRLITRLIDSMHRFRQFSMKTRLQLLGLSLLSHSLGALVYFLLSDALDLGLSYAVCGWLRAVLHLLFLLPLTVSGIGVRESALILLLAPLGISSPQAVAFSILLTLGLLLIAGLGGLLAPGMYVARRKAPGMINPRAPTQSRNTHQ
jgi:uncharacterized protein (TIRG00374 family)